MHRTFDSIILLLYLAHTCLGSTAASYTSADGIALTRSNDDRILDVHDVEKVRNETDATKIKHILDRISSWMKEKRKTDNKRNNNRQEYNVNHDTTRQCHRPFVTMAYAQSLDGMIATQTNQGDEEERAHVAKSKNLQLSCPTSMELTHNLRNMHDAILVGGTTFLVDQPRLNVRLLAPSTSSSSSTQLSSHEIIQQPMPVILDTNLHNLQHLLFNRTISNTDLDSWHQSTTKDIMTLQLPDIILQRIKAKNPTICCSSEAAKSFLDIIEVIVQDQEEYVSNNKRKKKKTYSITVYKTIEDGEEVSATTNNNNSNNYLPIKITIRINHYHRNSRNAEIDDDDDLLNELLTFTLLPCQTITKIRQTDANNNCDIDDDEHTTTTTTMKKTNSHELNLRHVLHQLHTQFDIDSIMVEGGSSILSSFINECCNLSGGNDSFSDSTTWSKDTGSIVDCICVTIAPKIIGGKWGLPVLGGLAGDSRSSDPCEKLITIKNGEFVTLGGQDCTFLGRIRLKEGLHSLSTTY